MRIAVLIHLFYTDLYDDYKERLKKIPVPFDLYINMINDGINTLHMIEQIKKDFPKVKGIVSQNTGRDIGGQLRLMREAKDYDYYIFLHTKKSPHLKNGHPNFSSGDWWREELLKIIDPENVTKILKAFEDEKIGMVGNHKFISGSYLPVEKKFIENNKELINKYCWLFDFNWKHLQFIGGTMFWVRGQIFSDFFTDETIEFLLGELSEIEDAEDNTAAHVMERLFGLIVKENGYNIVGI